VTGPWHTFVFEFSVMGFSWYHRFISKLFCTLYSGVSLVWALLLWNIWTADTKVFRGRAGCVTSGLLGKLLNVCLPKCRNGCLNKALVYVWHFRAAWKNLLYVQNLSHLVSTKCVCLFAVTCCLVPETQQVLFVCSKARSNYETGLIKYILLMLDDLCDL